MTLQAWTLLLVFLLSLLLLAWPLSHLLTRLIDGELPRPLLRMARLHPRHTAVQPDGRPDGREDLA